MIRSTARPPPRSAVLSVTDRGLYCAAGDFFVDPWRPVPRAVITHAHSDHARPGHGAYLSTDATAPVMRHRLGSIRLETLGWGEAVRIGGAMVSLHPAGHVPGSAQVRIEVGGEVWVVSGDYKTEADGLSEPFEPLPCHVFVSECTFGLPVFRWAPQVRVMGEILDWWQRCREAGRVAALGVYALGKAQRLLAGLAAAAGAGRVDEAGRAAGGALPGPILTHGAVEAVTEVLRAQGYRLPPTQAVVTHPPRRLPVGALVLAPPSALAGTWLRRLGPAETGIVSGWMQLRGIRRRRGAARGFVLSDHADWDGLNAAIAATGAERVLVTHGYTASFRRWLAETGLDAGIVATEFGGEEGADGTESDRAETPTPRADLGIAVAREAMPDDGMLPRGVSDWGDETAGAGGGCSGAPGDDGAADRGVPGIAEPAATAGGGSEGTAQDQPGTPAGRPARLGTGPRGGQGEATPGVPPGTGQEAGPE